MVSFAAVAVCVALGALAIFQLLLVLGAPLGRLAWGGQHRVLPVSLRVGSGLSILIYTVIAVVVLARAGYVWSGAREGIIRTMTWVVVAYFFVGTGLNLASRSLPERAVMSPLCAMLCALCAVVALG